MLGDRNVSVVSISADRESEDGQEYVDGESAGIGAFIAMWVTLKVVQSSVYRLGRCGFRVVAVRSSHNGELKVCRGRSRRGG